MSSRRWNVLPPFSYTPSPHRSWRHPKTLPDEPDGDTDWADDDSQAASSTVSRTPSTGPPRKKRKTRKHFFTRPKSSASTREPTWEPEEEDPDMLDSITVAGGFLIVGKGAIDPLSSSPPPPPPPKKKGPGRPPGTPKTPGSTAKKTKGKTKTAKKPTPSTSTRKGRSAANAAKQVLPELGHHEPPHPPTKSLTTKRPGSSSANRGRRESPAPRTATPPALNAPHAQDDPMPSLRNEIPSSVIDSDSGTQTPPNAPTPTSTDPAPPEPPPAPASVTWPTALTPPPPNPHVNELAARLTFNIYAFPALNHPCYVLGQDLLPPRDERSSPLADIFPDAESPPRHEVKPCYERLRYVVGKEMGLLLPEAGADQEWGIFVNYHFPVQDQEQLDVCMAHLVHHGRPVHDIVLSKRGNPELYQAALEDVRSEDRDFWKGRRGQMPGAKTGVTLLQRGVGRSKAKAKPRNKVKKKGKEKERKEPAGKKQTAEEDTEMDMGREIRDSMEPSPSPSVVVSSLAPEIGTMLLRISPVPNAYQESRLIEDDESTTSTPAQMFSTKVQRVAAPPLPMAKDNEKENESLPTPEETTDSSRAGKRKIGGYSSTASISLGNNRNESKCSSAPKAETSSSRQKGKGKDVDMSSSKESTAVPGPERKRRKTSTESPPRATLIPEASTGPKKPEVPEEPEVPEVPMNTNISGEPEMSMAIDLTEDPEVPAETHTPEDPEVLSQTEPTEGKESPNQTKPPKEIEPPKETQLPIDIKPQPVPEVSQVPPVRAASEVADSIASTETQRTPEIQQPTAPADAPIVELPQKAPLATEAPQAVVETITPEIPVILGQSEEPTPMETEIPEETAEEPPNALEEAAEEQPKALDGAKIPEPEAGENTVTTTAEQLSQDVVDDVRVRARARAQKLVTNEEVKEFHNLNRNRLIEAEAKEKEAGAIETVVEEGVKEGDEETLKDKVVNNNEGPAAKWVVGDEAVIEEPKYDNNEESSLKELENDVDMVPTKEPEVASGAQGSEHEDPGETPAKLSASEGARQSTPQPEGEPVLATSLNAAVAADHTEDAPKVDVPPPPAAVEEPQVSASTPPVVVVDAASVVVVEGIEDAPAKALDDSGHVSEADPPAQASTPPPPPPLETVHTSMDTSSPDPNDEVDMIMTNNDAGESIVQPTLPEQDLSAANTVSEQDSTVPMDIDDESRPPVNDEVSNGEGKEILETTDTLNEEQERTVPEPATNDAEAEGSSAVQTYSQSVDIQHGASLLLWAAEVPAEELIADTPVLEKNSPLPVTLPVPPVSAPPASAPAVQIAEEPQVSQQPDKVHEAIAVTATPSVKRRSRAKNTASKDTTKPPKGTAKPKTPKTKLTGIRRAAKRSLVVSLKMRRAGGAQDEGTSPSRAEESHPDGAAVAASTTRTPPPATPSNNWLPAPTGFTPVNPPNAPSPIRVSPSTPAPLPRPQPYRRPEPTTAPRQIAAKPGGESPNPRSTSSAELLAAARKQTGQTKNAKSKVAGSRVGSATSTPDYPNAPIPSPIASPHSLGRLATNARRNQPSESTPSPNRPVQQQPQLAVVAPPPVDEPIIQQAPVPVVATARNVSPLAIDKNKEMQVHPVPDDSPAASSAQVLEVPTAPAAVQVTQTPLNNSGRRLGSSKLREMQINDPSSSNTTPINTNPLPAQRIDPQASPAAREQTPVPTTMSIPPNTSPTTAEKAMASTKSPGLSVDVTTTRQSTPLSLPPARSTLTPEYIDSKKIQPLVPRENFLYWEPSLGKVGGADIKQPIGTLLGEASSASVSPIHASASGLVTSFPMSMGPNRPLFSQPPLRPLSPIRVSPSPPPQPNPQVQSPVQPKPQPQVQQQVQPQVKPQIQPQVQSQVQPQPQPQVQPQAQLQEPPQTPQAQPDVQPAPPPQPDPPAVVSPAPVTTKEMIFHIAHYEGNDQKITLHGRDFLSPAGFDWNRFVGVLMQMMSFNDVHEALVVNLHHLVDDGKSLNEGIPFYRKINEVLIAKVDPVGRPPKELWEKIKCERKKLRARFDE